MNKNEGVAIVPLSAFTDQRLTSSERFTLIALLSFANAEGKCWPSLTRIAERTGFSRCGVTKILGSLEKKGIISRERRTESESREHISTLYSITSKYHLPPSKPVLPPNKDTLLQVANQFNQGGKPSLPEHIQLTNHIELDKKNRVEKESGTRKVRKNKSIPENLLSLYHQLEDLMQTACRESGVTYDFGREGRALASLVQKAANPDDLLEIVRKFIELTRSTDRFWSAQPPLPSALGPLLPRVQKILHDDMQRQGRNTLHRISELPRATHNLICPFCKTTIPAGAMACPKCNAPISSLLGQKESSKIPEALNA